ncbi:uncharacterized protein LOC124353800 [Homalodisca vitripennis]|uniref:uncharacterized protein LOC124353800 n=1 Tax=Homalodisca vitripennis TaxID=197043 RepID=UPI001EEA59D7|nr:uncharacterized protein LOC124353800 [Homalodisca vitripennis]
MRIYSIFVFSDMEEDDSWLLSDGEIVDALFPPSDLSEDCDDLDADPDYCPEDEDDIDPVRSKKSTQPLFLKCRYAIAEGPQTVRVIHPTPDQAPQMYLLQDPPPQAQARQPKHFQQLIVWN